MIPTGQTTNTIQEARKRKTRLFAEQRDVFMTMLVKDINAAIRYAHKRDYTPVFRLNGTSDIVWESIPVTINGTLYENVFAAFPTVQFYDYTKAPYGARRHDIQNYHLTFSYAESVANHLNAQLWLAKGHSMSAVFAVKHAEDLPKSYLGRPVINGDESDLRFLDPWGVVVGLKAKGYSKQLSKANGFVITA